MKTKDIRSLQNKHRETVGITKVGGRLYVTLYNNFDYNFADIDLVDIIDWVKKNKPELLKQGEQ